MRYANCATTVLAGLLLAAGAAFGQATAPAAAARPEFEVASVRPSAPLDMAKLQAQVASGKMPRMGEHVDGLLAEYNYLSIKDLMQIAYKVKPYQITGPDWLGTLRFDISARMPEGSKKDDAAKMLRTLLDERFQLKLHRETQEHPVFALVVSKDGPKLKDSPATNAAIDPETPLAKGEIQADGPDGPVRMTTHSDGSMTMNMGAKGVTTIRMDSQTMHMESTMTTMDGFADMLTQVLQMGGNSTKPVVDMTGLKGNYQIALDISMAEIMAIAQSQAATMGISMPQPQGRGGASGASNAPVEASEPSGGSSVFKSVEALGLKLENQKAPVEQLVVDSAEKTPTEN